MSGSNARCRHTRLESGSAWVRLGWAGFPKSKGEQEEASMTKTELIPFGAILSAPIIHPAQLIRHRDEIRDERSADRLEEIQQHRNIRTPFVISTETLAICETWPSAVRKKAASRCAGSVMATALPSALARRHGRHFVFGAKKHSTATPEEMQSPPRNLLPLKPLEYPL